MIPFDFEYYRPDTVEEAVKLYETLSSGGKKVIYYGGGTEFISMARMNNMYADAVIDTKGIRECNAYQLENERLTIGSAVTLTKIAELNIFTLLTLAVSRIADHTIQDKITLGGNIIGSIIYKESLLPLLVSDSEIVLVGPKGRRNVPINEAFSKKLSFEEGEMLLRVNIDKRYLELPYSHVKRTKNEKIDYPLITMVAINDRGKLKVAFSGLCDYPFRSRDMENVLNDRGKNYEERINIAIGKVPGRILTDVSGSKEYRQFVFGLMLGEVFNKLGVD
ncbi:FAD binding domain-containing protein [Tissierella sp. Yu-01]|uniref:FAD binding domain-containing protein n=1 Tax=Tissierella sp. Yu-01 TaxID=3035694 RepID=UPI00240E92D1|nr:FAD binding domain-containing protein [Tissierella sp. Yu-01]WFA10437.1 FAD binding domain-containing protein [Tissierella sp. Yu-01]